jgi:hypothetical protein
MPSMGPAATSMGTGGPGWEATIGCHRRTRWGIDGWGSPARGRWNGCAQYGVHGNAARIIASRFYATLDLRYSRFLYVCPVSADRRPSMGRLAQIGWSIMGILTAHGGSNACWMLKFLSTTVERSKLGEARPARVPLDAHLEGRIDVACCGRKHSCAHGVWLRRRIEHKPAKNYHTCSPDPIGFQSPS